MTRWFVLMVLLAAAFKDDSAVINDSEYWSTLAVSPLVAYLKQGVWLFVAAAVVSAAVVLRRGMQRIVVAPAAILLILFYAGAAIRALYHDGGAALKVAFALGVSMALCIVAGVALARDRAAFRFDVQSALVWFACMFVLVNLWNVATGFGFVPGNARLFGTATHPNFLGMHLAMCNVILFSSISWRDRRRAIPLLLLLAAGLALQVMSGSRTSLVAVAVGLLCLALSLSGFRLRPSLVLALAAPVAMGALAYALVPELIAPAFERGIQGGDTRSAVWAQMLESIAQRPWLGSGYFDGPSESSLLRAMTAFGIPAGLMLAFTIGVLLRSLVKNYRCQPTDVFVRLALALAASLVAGSVFEGYLTDMWSLPRVVFLLVALGSVSVAGNRAASRVHREPPSLMHRTASRA